MSNFISLEKAIEMTSLYRQQMETILASQFKGLDILAKSEIFSRDQVEKLLSKPECGQLRVYYGMSQDLKIHALLVGVDQNGNDILGSDKLSSASQEVLEDALRCPPHCPPSSPLNS
jgi:hypothetical protein